MKILQLNAWTGRVKGGILKLVKEGNYDVICLQEAVWATAPEGELGRVNAQLENFAASVEQLKEAGGVKYDFRSSNWGVGLLGGRMEQGNVILSREPMTETAELQVCGEYNGAVEFEKFENQGYTAQKVRLEGGLTVVNYHGYWLPTPVGDERTVATMHKVAEWIRSEEGPLVMCGDLNVVHEAPAMRELDFLRDLTAEYGVKNTLAGLKFDGQVACDHILVNDEVWVRAFEVKEGRIASDHWALEAEIEVGRDNRRE